MAIKSLEAQYEFTTRRLTPEKPSDYESRIVDQKRLKREKQSQVIESQARRKEYLLRKKSLLESKPKNDEKQEKINILMKIKDIT